MDIKKIFENHSGAIAICMVDEEEGLKEIEKFHKEFNEKYQIVPIASNEIWCVVMTIADHIDSTTIQGPFESKEIAVEFAVQWNKRREAFCDKTIEEDPDGDYEFNYIKAKAVQLGFSPGNKQLLDEIKGI